MDSDEFWFLTQLIGQFGGRNELSRIVLDLSPKRRIWHRGVSLHIQCRIPNSGSVSSCSAGICCYYALHAWNSVRHSREDKMNRPRLCPKRISDNGEMRHVPKGGGGGGQKTQT